MAKVSPCKMSECHSERVNDDDEEGLLVRDPLSLSTTRGNERSGEGEISRTLNAEFCSRFFAKFSLSLSTQHIGSKSTSTNVNLGTAAPHAYLASSI